MLKYDTNTVVHLYLPVGPVEGNFCSPDVSFSISLASFYKTLCTIGPVSLNTLYQYQPTAAQSTSEADSRERTRPLSPKSTALVLKYHHEACCINLQIYRKLICQDFVWNSWAHNICNICLPCIIRNFPITNEANGIVPHQKWQQSCLHHKHKTLKMTRFSTFM